MWWCILITFFLAASTNQITQASAELCILSVKSNAIIYELHNDNSSSESIIERKVFSLKNLRAIAHTALALSLEVTLKADNTTEDKPQHKVQYFATQTDLLLIVKPEVFDSLTFGALSYTERILPLSLTLLTSNICSSNDDFSDYGVDASISIILQSILAPFDFQHLKQMSGPESILLAVKSSGILLFMSSAILSLLVVFLVMPVCVKRCISLHTSSSSSTRSQPQHKAASINEHTVLVGVYFVSICCAAAYVGYWVVVISGFVLRDTSKYNSDVLAVERKSVSPFIVNGLFVTLMSITSMVTALLITAKQNRSSKLRLSFKSFIYAGSSCMVMLLTCAVYHGFFLTLSVAIDYKTTINEIFYLGTLVIAIYCSIPVVLKQFYSSRKNKECANFLFSSSLLLTVLVLYCILISELGSNDNYQSDLPNLAATVLSSVITLAIITAIVALAFSNEKKGAALNLSKPSKKPENNDHKNTNNAEGKVVKPSKLKMERSVPQLIYIMFSNPGSIVAMVQQQQQHNCDIPSISQATKV